MAAVARKPAPASVRKKTGQGVVNPGSRWRQADLTGDLHKGGGDHAEGSWIFSYADMITILLMFFILMLSVSNLSAEKFKQVQKALNPTDVADAKDAPASAPDTPETKLLKQLLAQAKPDSPQLADVPLDALARQAAEAGGDRSAQIIAGARILLGTLDKKAVEADAVLAAELARTADEIRSVSELTATSLEGRGNAGHFRLVVPGGELFVGPRAELSVAAKEFLRTLALKAKSLSFTPTLRVEVRSTLKTPRVPTQAEFANGLALAQERAAAVHLHLLELGSEPLFLSSQGLVSHTVTADGRAARREVTVTITMERPAPESPATVPEPPESPEVSKEVP